MTEPAALPDAADCPSEDEVLAFAAGRLSSEQRRHLHPHFDGCEHCQRLLNEAVHALATAQTSGLGVDAAEDELTWSATFRPGMIVGQRYVIRQFIARGGMGEVYEAFDQDLQERVALKTVTSTSSDDRTAVRRLKAEVQLARRVSHPNVCRIYDFGTHTGHGMRAPISFLTMEFVDGETLGQRIRSRGALTIAEARRLGRELLNGLQAAHSAGVLHRDFKSDNVMLRRDAHGSSPVIMDFGLARTLEHHSRASSASHRGLVGTLAYIAPEQFDGQPYTTAGDVYSFGVVWFEMLTGELPFKPSSSPTVTTLDRLTRPASPPSSVSPLVPADLDEVVLGCLRRTEQERFKTVSDVLTRLDELESRTRLPRRSRWIALAAIGSLLGVLVAFALTARHYSRAMHLASPKSLIPSAVKGIAAEAAPAVIGRVPADPPVAIHVPVAPPASAPSPETSPPSSGVKPVAKKHPDPGQAASSQQPRGETASSAQNTAGKPTESPIPQSAASRDGWEAFPPASKGGSSRAGAPAGPSLQLRAVQN
jgi:serine/threonine protein kinase